MFSSVFRCLAESHRSCVLAIALLGVQIPLSVAYAAPVPLNAIPFCVDSSDAVVDNGVPGQLCISVIPDVSPSGFSPGDDPIEYAVTLPHETHIELFPVASDSADATLGALLFALLGEEGSLVDFEGNLSDNDDEIIPGTDFVGQMVIGGEPTAFFPVMGLDVSLLIPVDGCVEAFGTWVCSQSFPILDNADFRDGLLVHDIHFGVGCDPDTDACDPFMVQPLGAFFYPQSLLTGASRLVGVVDSRVSIPEPASLSLLGASLAFLGFATRSNRRRT